MRRLFYQVVCVGVAIALSVNGMLAAASGDVPQRPIRVDDLLEEEPTPGSVAFSPDGLAVAFVRRRPLKAYPPSERTSLVAEVGGDIWLQDAPGRAPRNLTRGVTDGSRWWEPQWAPDGQRLAFLSTRGDHVRVWLWERATDQLRPASRESVIWREKMPREEAFRWITSHRLLCFGPLDGEPVRPRSFMGEAVHAATQAWTRAAQGDVTASAVDSLTFPLPSRRLFVVDVGTGKVSIVAETVGHGRGIPRRSWWSSPTGQVVMVMRSAPPVHGIGVSSRIGTPQTLDIRWVDGRPVRLDQPLPSNVLTDTLAWSPDGESVAFFAYGDAPINLAVLYGRPAAAVMPDYVDGLSMENPAKLWRVDLPTGSVTELGTGEIDLGYLGAPEMIWTAGGELIVNAPRRRYGATRPNHVPRLGAWGSQQGPLGGFTPPSEWWVLGRDGSSRPLSTTLPRPVGSLQVMDDGETALAVVDHDLWCVELRGGETKNLTSEFSPLVTAIRQLPQTNRSSRVLLTARDEAGQSLRDYVLDRTLGTVAPVVRPSANATVVAFMPTVQSVVHLADDHEGTVLWRSGPRGPSDRLIETNTHRRSIAKRQTRHFQFTNMHNQALKGVLTLPSGYQAGRRYPLVAAVYIGRRTSANVRDPIFPSVTMVDLMASAGYAILEMEIPLNPPMLDTESAMSTSMLISSVLPAVNRAIEMGIADPDRLFAFGHSDGGWSVANLLAQTTRFKAAVAWAGSYDQLVVPSGPLGRSIDRRFDTSPHAFAGPAGAGKRTHPTEVPWWRALADIRQNSPLTYVERVQTPLLMLHGDLDPVTIEPAEDYFNALVSMRKRAQFVRYWGEGHIFQSPENVRNAYQRIFAWFDDFGDIARDHEGNMRFEGDTAQSRKGAPALTLDDFARFGPAATAESHRQPSTGQH